MALDVLAGKSITETAQKYGVSRNSIYAQKHEAEMAIHHAFSDKGGGDVLFYLPVSKRLIAQIVLGLMLICKANYRDVIQFFHDVFDYPISIGTVASIVDSADDCAASINATYDLSSIRESAADEVFHRNQPILATVDINSRFCAMLEKEEHRDADSWGVHLLDLINKGFQPDINISDQAAGIKKAFADTLPETELRFDHFQLIKASKDLARFLKNRKDSATTQAVELYERKERADRRGKTHHLDERLRAANVAMAAADSLHELVGSLCT